MSLWIWQLSSGTAIAVPLKNTGKIAHQRISAIQNQIIEVSVLFAWTFWLCRGSVGQSEGWRTSTTGHAHAVTDPGSEGFLTFCKTLSKASCDGTLASVRLLLWHPCHNQELFWHYTDSRSSWFARIPCLLISSTIYISCWHLASWGFFSFSYLM